MAANYQTLQQILQNPMKGQSNSGVARTYTRDPNSQYRQWYNTNMKPVLDLGGLSPTERSPWGTAPAHDPLAFQASQNNAAQYINGLLDRRDSRGQKAPLSPYEKLALMKAQIPQDPGREGGGMSQMDYALASKGYDAALGYQYFKDTLPEELKFLGDAQVAGKKYGSQIKQGNAANLIAEMNSLVPYGYNVGTKAGKNDKMFSLIAPDLARYGVNSLNDLTSYSVTNPYTGKKQDIFYNKATKTILPTEFGSSMKGEGGTWFQLANVGGKVIPITKWSDTNNWDDYSGLLAVAAVLGGGALYAAYGGGAAAAGAGAAEGAAGAAGAAELGGLAGTAGIAEGATGLASLPMAGTWAQSALPALGAGAGAWTSPAALAGIEGLTTAGGLTLGGSLASANALGDMLGTFGTSLGGSYSTTANTFLDSLKNLYNSSGVSNTNGISNLKDVQKLSFNNDNNNQGGNMSLGNTNILPALGGLYNYFQGNQMGGTLQDIANKALTQGDPFAKWRAQYGQMLSDSYSNPQSVFDNYYSALDEKLFGELKAQDAARGRSTDAYKRGVTREAAFQNWMTNYQNQLSGLAGANINPNTALENYASLMALSNASNMQGSNALIGGLGSLFGGNASGQGGGLSVNNLIDLGKGAVSLGSQGWDWLSSLF